MKNLLLLDTSHVRDAKVDKKERSKDGSTKKTQVLRDNQKEEKMKNVNLVKKFAAIVVSAVMVLSTLVVPTFAANGPIKIEGLEKGVSATAYKIADVNNENRFERVEGVGKDKLANPYQPTYDEIMALAADTTLLATLTKTDSVAANDAGEANFTGMAPGIYLVKFEIGEKANPQYFYNPVIVSVDKDGKANGFNVEGASYGADAIAKKSPIEFDKVIERTLDKIAGDDKGTNTPNDLTGKDESLVNGGNRGDTASVSDNKVGDTISFRINSTLPAYADNYFTAATSGNADLKGTKDPGFVIYDNLDGLTLKKGTVKLYDKDGNAIDESYYTVAEEDNGFTVTFKGVGVWNLRGQKVEVRYSATVNDNAARVNFNPDTNTAGYKFTRNPGEEPSDGEERTTYHYKFTINGKIQGNDGKENREVIKVGTDSNGDQIVVEKADGTITDVEGWQVLEGVTFKLKDANGNVVRDNVYSDKDGILRGMDQLDAGTYQLVEDDPQEVFSSEKYKDKNYKPNTNPIEIKIEANLLEDGRLDSYMVSVAGEVVGNYKADYTKDYDLTKGTMKKDVAGSFFEVDGSTVGAGVAIDHQHDVKADGTDTGYDDWGAAVDINNTQVGTLPATGGMGTVLFTVGGIAIMALALFLLFGGKKRNEESN